MRGIVVRQMSWMMDRKWIKYEYSEEAVGDAWRRLWENCGGGCGRCVDVLGELKYVQYT